MKIGKVIFLLFSFCLLSGNALASPPQGKTINKTTVAKLQQTFAKYGYLDHRLSPTVPRIFLQHMPTDYNQIKDLDTRNFLFIRILSPLALKVNEDILAERQKLQQFSDKLKNEQELTPKETLELENLSKKYDVFTRLQGLQRAQRQIEQLLIKVDQVYPSFLIGMAAIETNWGTSRIVKEGNSLYKELSWYSNEGLIPQGENDDKTYKIRIFPDLYSSMQSFALHINTDISFDHTRNMRKLQRDNEMIPSGATLAHTLLYQSPLNNYPGILDYNINFYKLMLIDQAALENHSPQPTTQEERIKQIIDPKI